MHAGSEVVGQEDNPDEDSEAGECGRKGMNSSKLWYCRAVTADEEHGVMKEYMQAKQIEQQEKEARAATRAAAKKS